MNYYTNKPNVVGSYKFYHPTRHVMLDSTLTIPEAGFNLGTGGYLLTPSSTVYSFPGLSVKRSDGFPVPANTIFSFKKEDISTTPPAPVANNTYAGTYLYTKGTNVNQRSGAGTSYSIVKTFPASGTAIGPVIESFTGNDGALWHRFTSGYIRADLTTTTKNQTPAEAAQSGNDTLVPPKPQTAGFAGTFLMWGLLIAIVVPAFFWPAKGR